MMQNKKRGRPSASTPVLTAETILNTAKALMLEEGSIPSLRKIASQLDVDVMAIYHYFKNKGELLEALATSLISDIYCPTGEHSWQQELRLLSRSYIELLCKYSGLLEILLSMQSISPAMVFIERFNSILDELELEETTRKNALDLLADYLHGFALAMNHNQAPQTELTLDMLEGPLEFYINSLEASL